MTIEVRRTGPTRWEAFDDGAQRGRARVWRRPDARHLLLLDHATTAAIGPLVDAAVVGSDVALHAWVDTTDDALAEVLGARGFCRVRVEDHHVAAVPDDPAPPLPAGYAMVPADRVDEDALRRLDERLRDDVPGTDGWAWDPEDFREENFHSPAFDPALYPVARTTGAGTLVGLARIWVNPDRHRVGLVAVLPEHRRCGIGDALLGHALAVLRERGATEVGIEIDRDNAASHGFFDRLGLTVERSFVEMVRPAAAPR